MKGVMLIQYISMGKNISSLISKVNIFTKLKVSLHGNDDADYKENKAR